MIKLLLGGSPCTHWSIAQSKNRETAPSGVGWELFRNVLIACDRYNPDFTLYENNKSAAPAIKDQIIREFQARNPAMQMQYINSALVSAQNRQRFYCHNFGDVPQPADRGILLRDILESGAAVREKGYALTSAGYGATAEDAFKHRQRNVVCEPIRIGTIENDAQNQNHDSQQYRVYSPEGKSVTLCGNGGGVGAKTGLYATPFQAVDYAPLEGCEIVSSDNGLRCVYSKGKYNGGGTAQGYHVQLPDTKMRTLMAGHAHKEKIIVPHETAPGAKPVYRVQNGMIEIKGQLYPIKLPDGYYIIRKLTVTECCRLQTLPDDYCRAVSATQAYKGLGNGWTAEVIIHLLSHALRGVSRDERLVVLSLYDGIGTGRYCLDKMGFRNVDYYAYEIDKYAIQVAMSNYPDIIQCGDAFQVRGDGWGLDEGRIAV